MGGIGSGRGYQGGRRTTEDSRPLDIREIHRARLLSLGRWFSWQWKINGREVASIDVRVEAQCVTLIYRHRRSDADWQHVEQPVNLNRTVCTFGGTRPWWLCPSCGQRVAVLYRPRKRYACRHCCRLAYACQRETADDRTVRRTDTIRRRLGWKAGILNGVGNKPKGMRWRTFERLWAEHDVLYRQVLAGIARRLGLIKRGSTGSDEFLGGNL